VSPRGAVVAACVAFAATAAPAARRPARAQTAPAGRLIRVPGAELHVREQGRGEPLILLHGFLECGSAARRSRLDTERVSDLALDRVPPRHGSR
jgi:hypothetical protein